MIVAQNRTVDRLPYLLSTQAIRDQAQRMLRIGENAELSYFHYHPDSLEYVVQYVLRTMRERIPDLKIPNHSRINHFKVGQINGIESLNQNISKIERVKMVFECVFLSVLLDGGAGSNWFYIEPNSNQKFTRSEGLGLATFYAFLEGQFSDPKSNHVTAESLESVSLETFKDIFQISECNQLIGLEDRLSLLYRLALCLHDKGELFGPERRLGNLMTRIIPDFEDQPISANTIFNEIMGAFSDLWGYGAIFEGQHLGDVWHYSKFGEAYEKSLIPFHKLTQWLCYSIIDMLETLGYRIVDHSVLTGLAEYRNGGLIVDAGILVPRRPNDLLTPHAVNSDFVIEWRAMTVALLDILLDKLRQESNLPLSMSQALEGGTWWAGRKIALEKRNSLEAPIKIRANGIIF
ncbi:MAG: DUF1688 family protein [Gammaproteobacteria bacterium]